MDRSKGRRGLLRGGVFAISVALVTCLFLAATGHITWPRRVLFEVVLAGVAVLNVAWWVRTDLRLSQTRRSDVTRRWSRVFLACYMVIMLAPLIGMVRGSLEWRRLPMPMVVWLQLWHMLIVVAVPIGAVVGVCVWLIRRAYRRMRPPVEGKEEVNQGRRAFLRRAMVAAPIVAVGGGTAAGLWQFNHLEKRRLTVSPPGLPDRLKGLTITHLSDFHIGRLYRMGHFRRAVEEANRFDSDIVVITGDLVDQTNDSLPLVVDSLRGLRHRHGMFLCIGNHDLIENGPVFADYLREEGLGLLVDERCELEIGGERVVIGGLMWDRHEGGIGPGRRNDHTVATFGPPPDGGPKPFTIALAHHPHAFDATARRGIALTLSGHTHGGQLMLAPPGWREIGAGNLLFRYIRGFYTGDGVAGEARALRTSACVRSDQPILFINAGAGNWFPVRMNAPAEIVQLRLV